MVRRDAASRPRPGATRSLARRGWPARRARAWSRRTTATARGAGGRGGRARDRCARARAPLHATAAGVPDEAPSRALGSRHEALEQRSSPPGSPRRAAMRCTPRAARTTLRGAVGCRAARGLQRGRRGRAAGRRSRGLPRPRRRGLPRGARGDQALEPTRLGSADADARAARARRVPRAEPERARGGSQRERARGLTAAGRGRDAGQPAPVRGAEEHRRRASRPRAGRGAPAWRAAAGWCWRSVGHARGAYERARAGVACVRAEPATMRGMPRRRGPWWATPTASCTSTRPCSRPSAWRAWRRRGRCAACSPTARCSSAGWRRQPRAPKRASLVPARRALHASGAGRRAARLAGLYQDMVPCAGARRGGSSKRWRWREIGGHARGVGRRPTACSRRARGAGHRARRPGPARRGDRQLGRAEAERSPPTPMRPPATCSSWVSSCAEQLGMAGRFDEAVAALGSATAGRRPSCPDFPASDDPGHAAARERPRRGSQREVPAAARHARSGRPLATRHEPRHHARQPRYRALRDRGAPTRRWRWWAPPSPSTRRSACRQRGWAACLHDRVRGHGTEPRGGWRTHAGRPSAGSRRSSAVMRPPRRSPAPTASSSRRRSKAARRRRRRRDSQRLPARSGASTSAPPSQRWPRSRSGRDPAPAGGDRGAAVHAPARPPRTSAGSRCSSAWARGAWARCGPRGISNLDRRVAIM